MNYKKKVLTMMMAVLAAGISAQTQYGLVKTRGRMVNGQHVAGKGLEGATVQVKGRSTILSRKGGWFSFPLTTSTYTIQSVKKPGYQLVDADMMKKTFLRSSDTLSIVMEKPEQQMEDLLEAEEKISRNLRLQIRKERQEIKRLKDQQTISEAEYERRIAKLMQNQENNQRRIAEMAREYAQMDYDQMDDTNRRISDAIINGRLMEADSLLRSKGDMNSRVAEVMRDLQAESQQENELARQLSELETSKAGTKKKLEDIADDCYKFFDRFKMENLHDSAAHYILLRAGLTEMALQRHTLKERSHTQTLRPEIVKWQFDAARYLLEQNQYPQSEELFVKALHNYRHMTADKGQEDSIGILSSGVWQSIAMTQSNLAVIYMHTQRYAESESAFKEAVNIYRHLIAYNPKVEEYMATALLNQAILYKNTHHFDDSEALNKEALEIYRRCSADHPQPHDGIGERDVCYALTCLADLYSNVNRLQESEALYLESLELLRPMTVANPQYYEPYLASTLNNLALLYDNTRQFDKAEPIYQESVEIYRRLAESNPFAYEPNMAKILNNFAIMYSKTQRFEEAEKLFLEVLAVRRRLMETDPKAYESDLATALANLGNLYKASGRGAEAEPHYLEALSMRRRLAADNPEVYEPSLATLLYNLAGLHGQTRQYDAAEQEYHEALAIRRRLAEATPQVYTASVSKTLESIADLYVLRNEFPKAEQYANEAIALNPSQLTTYSILAAAQLFQGRYGEAEKLYRQYKNEIKDILLEDLELYAQAGVTPRKQAHVERIKKMLGE